MIPLFLYTLVNVPQSSKALSELHMCVCMCWCVSLSARLRAGRGLAEGEPGQLIDRTNQYTHCSESHKGARRQRHWLLLLSASVCVYMCVCVTERGRTLLYVHIGLKLHQICHHWIYTLT